MPTPPTRNAVVPAEPRRHSRTAHDADDHAHNLSQWDQCYDQFSPGRFEGRVTELWLPGLQVFLESANQALHQACAAWEGAVWFGFPVPHKAATRIDARTLADHTVLFRPGNREFQLVTPEQAGIFGIVVSRELLDDYLIDTDELDREVSGGTGTLRVPPERYRQLIAMLGQLLDPAGGGNTPPCNGPAHRLAASRPDTLPARDQAGALQALILDQLGATLDAGYGPGPALHAAGLRNSRRIVESARHLVLSQPDQRVSIADLCRQLRVSRRTLQNCFQAVVGLPPLAYLRTLKLNQVRRRLRTASQPGVRVTQVATRWGFEHLGQFSRDYRLLFGESPSVTLRNACG